MRIEPFLLLQLMLGYTFASVCFIFGVSLHAWQFWAAIGITLSLAFFYSRRLGVGLLALNVFAFILTLYTFSYVHIDASICHLPMTHFMQDGWNPIRESSVEAVRNCFVARGMDNVDLFTILHIIAGPKFAQILAAQMQSATGLFTALGYPIWIMLFALGILAYRFSSAFWGISRWVSVAFAVLVTSNYIILENSFFGLVDYVTYAAISISAMSLGLWTKSKNIIDLVMFFAGLAIAVLSKFNSLVCVGLLIFLAAVIGWKNNQMRISFLVFFVVLMVLSIIPYWTSAWYHGSPFYPAHSFRDNVPIMDLNSDFIGNDDASKMGYIARMVYAWVNCSFAQWGCKLYYSLDSFEPCWKYDFLVRGENGFFCALLCSSVIFSLFINRNRATVIGWVLMLAFLILPVKYVGYSRYVSYVFFIVILFWFNILTAYKGKMSKFIQFVPIVSSVCMGIFFIKTYFSQICAEGIRQVNIASIAKNGGFYFNEPKSYWAYLLKRRLLIDGVTVSSEGENKLEIDWPFVLKGDTLNDYGDELSSSKVSIFPGPVWASRLQEEGVKSDF